MAQLKKVETLARDTSNVNLKFSGNVGTGTVNLATQNFSITGDGNVTTTAAANGMIVGLSKEVKAKIDSITPVKYMSINSIKTDADLTSKEKAAGKISNADNNGATGSDAIAIGLMASATGSSGVAIGKSTQAGENGVALGNGANALEGYAIAIGYNAKVENGPRYKDGVLDPTAKVTTPDGVAIGRSAQAFGLGATALGYDARAKVEGAAALGYASYATKVDSLSLGRKANAMHDSGVALGSYAKTDRLAGAKLGYDPLTNADSTDESATWKSTLGVVSIGDTASNKTRQIAGVAAGSLDTDAVNVAQLKQVVTLANNATAAAGDVTLNIAGNDDTKGSIKLSEKELAITGEGPIVATASDSGFNVKLDTEKFDQLLQNSASWKIQGNTDNPITVAPSDTVQFVNGTYTSVTVANDPATKTTSVKVDLNGDTINKINNIVDDKGNLKLNVKGEDGITVNTDNDGNTVVGLDDKVNVGQVAIDGKDGKGEITGLTNTTWNPENIVENRAATEGQLQGLAQDIAGDISDLNNAIKNNGKELNTEKATIGGNTTIDKDGITVNNPNGEGSTKITGDSITTGTVNTDKVVVGGNTYITDKGLNANNKVITGVAPGVNGTDAVNMNQLNEVAQGVNNVGSAVNRLSNRVDKVAAGSAALAALHPLDFDSDDKLSFAVGFGGYKGEHAAALGAFYRANDDLMFSLGATVGNSNDQYNAGVSFRFGESSPYTNMSKADMAAKLETQDKNMAALQADNEELKARLAKLEALVIAK